MASRRARPDELGQRPLDAAGSSRTLSLEDLLRRRLDVGGASPWHLLTEVVHGDRRADAIAVSTWSSRGLCCVGYEFKARRADFLKELDDPSKRRWLEQETAQQWFLCEPGVAKKEEIPVGWGLLEANGDRLYRRVQAQHDAAKKPSERLWYTLVHRSIEIAEAERGKHQNFAEWQGKPISYEGLARIAEKMFDHKLRWRQHEIEREFNERRRKLAKKSADDWEARWAKVFGRLSQLDRETAGGYRQWDNPQKALRIIDQHLAGRTIPDFRKEAERLRKIAADIELLAEGEKETQ